MKFLNVIFAAVIGCLATSCATENRGNISGGKNGNPVAAVAPAEPRTLGREDLFKVDLAVYSYLLQQQFWTSGNYATVFVQGGNDEFNVLINEFPNHVPPIKPTGRAQLQASGQLLDKDTGGWAILLSVSVGDAVGDTVQAEGRWFASSTVSGVRTFTLKQINGGWVIEAIK